MKCLLVEPRLDYGAAPPVKLMPAATDNFASCIKDRIILNEEWILERVSGV